MLSMETRHISNKLTAMILLVLALTIGIWQRSALSAYFAANLANVYFTKVLLAEQPATDAIHRAQEYYEKASYVRQDASIKVRHAQMLFLSEKYVKAEELLRQALIQDQHDWRIPWLLADVLSAQSLFQEAIGELIHWQERHPPNAHVDSKLADLYQVFAVTYTEPSQWSDVPHRSVGPGATERVTLALPAVQPRSFQLTYFDHVGSDIDIYVNEIAVGNIRGSGRNWRSQLFQVPPEAADVYTVTLTNPSAAGFPVSQLVPSYVTNVLRFSEVTNATWTETPHLALGPGDTRVFWLYTSEESTDTVNVVFYDFVGHTLQVEVDDQLVGEIRGGEDRKDRQGGWTPFTFHSPHSAGKLTKVRLTNPSAELGAAVSMIYLD